MIQVNTHHFWLKRAHPTGTIMSNLEKKGD